MLRTVQANYRLFDVAMHCLVFLFLIVAVVTQDCKVGGKRCADHEQCCGGCCIRGECLDTYRSCMLSFDVCRQHSCRGEESCVVYTPPNCPGCEPLPLCRITN